MKTKRTITLRISERDERLLASMIAEWIGDEDAPSNRMLRRVLEQLRQKRDDAKEHRGVSRKQRRIAEELVDDRTLTDEERDAIRESLAEVDRLRSALRNVRAFAASRLRKTDPENAGHLLRFCEEAGIVASVLRSEKP